MDGVKEPANLLRQHYVTLGTTFVCFVLLVWFCHFAFFGEHLTSLAAGTEKTFSTVTRDECQILINIVKCQRYLYIVGFKIFK